MPAVLRQDGFDVDIYTNDHEPPHVHVWKAEGEVVINLGEGAGIPTIRDVNRMGKKHVRKAYAIVEQGLYYLRDKWKETHG